MRSVKVCVVGDDGVGKTTLLQALARSVPDGDAAVPAAFENFAVALDAGDGARAQLRLFEVESREGFPREVLYPGTDVVVLCFSAIQMPSFENLTMRWGPELRAKLPRVPVLLVATKCEMRADPATLERMREMRLGAPVSPEQAQAKAQALGCVRCIESSNGGAHAAQEIFREAARAVLFPPAPPEKPSGACCCVL